jgi:Tfp pilus assembly protein PilX
MMFPSAPSSQRGIALPVMLIIMVVMLVGGVYLFKSSNSTTLTTANLAYDAAQSKAADFGLHSAFEWLSSTANTNKAALNADDGDHGYKATLDTTLAVSSSDFWSGSATVTDAGGNTIEYVVHRMCALPGPFDSANNACVQTAANTSTLNNSVALGTSLASDAPTFNGSAQLHYVITARIFGARGGHVVNQAGVMIGA